jgi:adenylyl-sulfate kinase
MVEIERIDMERGFTVWFTGLSGSGKTTLAHLLEAELRKRGLTRIEILDGDVVRTHLSKGLGFTKEDRDTNIKRIGFVCKLLSRNGVVAIAAAISPYREIRDHNRKEIGDFIEVYCKCSLNVCIKRDVKGLYKKAIAGEIKNYTGIDDPYEEPLNPEVQLETDRETPEESVQRILQKLEILGYIPAVEEAVYTTEEEEKVKKRLEGCGYL